MKNIANNKKLVGQAREGEIKVFDHYGNILRFVDRLGGWQVELSDTEADRKLFRPLVVLDGRWYPYDIEMGIYTKE